MRPADRPGDTPRLCRCPSCRERVPAPATGRHRLCVKCGAILRGTELSPRPKPSASRRQPPEAAPTQLIDLDPADFAAALGDANPDRLDTPPPQPANDDPIYFICIAC